MCELLRLVSNDWLQNQEQAVVSEECLAAEPATSCICRWRVLQVQNQSQAVAVGEE